MRWMFCIFLVGCGIDLKLDNPGTIDVEVMEIPEIKIVGGQVFLRSEGHCIAIDHSLETDWVSVVIIDGYRGDYSEIEEHHCEAGQVAVNPR